MLKFYVGINARQYHPTSLFHSFVSSTIGHLIYLNALFIHIQVFFYLFISFNALTSFSFVPFKGGGTTLTSFSFKFLVDTS